MFMGGQWTNTMDMTIVLEALAGFSLGAESIALFARVGGFAIALLIVLVYMIFYYQTAGLAANFALVLNILFIFGVLSSLGAVLSLPGIAGIVLTIGMAVDANVLIYERIREELRAGKGMSLAISDGYNNAYAAIIDANVTTLLTGVILYTFGTGPIKGFATTLIIGIITSLFAAIFLTRLVFESKMASKKPIKFASKMTENWFANNNFAFIAKRKTAYIFSSLLIVLGISSLATRGLNEGVDFKGGRTFVVRFDQDVVTQEVRSSLATPFETAPEVKTLGTGKVIVTTKYLADNEGREASNRVETALYAGIKGMLPADMDVFKFTDQYDDKAFGVLESAHVQSTIADDIIEASYSSVAFALIAIFAYVVLRFRKWQFGLGALIAVFHDVLIVLGIFSLTYSIMPFSMNTSFVAAVLTVVGYSINDTVVVFDRVRERVNGGGKSEGISLVVNKALNSTLSRTFNTSMTIKVFFL